MSSRKSDNRMMDSPDAFTPSRAVMLEGNGDVQAFIEAREGYEADPHAHDVGGDNADGHPADRHDSNTRNIEAHEAESPSAEIAEFATFLEDFSNESSQHTGSTLGVETIQSDLAHELFGVLQAHNAADVDLIQPPPALDAFEEPPELEEYEEPPGLAEFEESSDLPVPTPTASIPSALPNQPVDENPGVEIELPEDADADLPLDGDYQDPRAVPLKTRFSFSNHPLIKAVGLGSVGLVGVILGFALLKGMVTTKDVTPSANLSAIESEAETDAEVDQVAMAKEGEADSLAKLALSDQTEANAAFMNRHSAAEGEENPAVDEESVEVIEPTPPPVPEPVQPIQSAPIVAASPPQPLPTPLPTPPPAYGSDLSSVEQWQLVASLGAFGQPSAQLQLTPSPMPSAPPQPQSPSLFDPSSYTSPVTSAPTPAPVTVASGPMSIDQMRNSSSVPGLRDAPMATVLVGTRSSGHLTTDIILSSDGSTNTNPNDPLSPKYLITLTSDILDTNGGIAIPSGTQVVAVVSNFSPNNGVVQLVAQAVLHEGNEYTLPEGAILVQGEDGGFLTANARNAGGLRQALLPAVLEGVAAAGQALNEDASSIIANGSSSVTTTSSESNIPAAAVGGFADSLADTISRQSEQANQRALQRDEVWELDAGDQVTLVVNSTFHM